MQIVNFIRFIFLHGRTSFINFHMTWWSKVIPKLVLVLAVSPLSAGTLEHPNFEIRFLSKERVEEFKGNLFELNEQGKLLRGFRSHPNDPIDYSVLLKKEVLAEDFAKASLGCHDCKPDPFLWKGWRISYGVSRQNNNEILRFIFSASSDIYEVFEQAQISLDATSELNGANLIVVFGESDFLFSEAQRLKDGEGIEYYSTLNSNNRQQTKDGAGGLFLDTSCRFFSYEKGSLRKAYAYLTPKDINTCFTKQLLLAAGLKPFDGVTPSVLNTNVNYTKATVADLLFLRIHYFLGGEEFEKFDAYKSAALDLIEIDDFVDQLR